MRVVALPAVFVADIALKVIARTNPDALGHFLFSTQIGAIGFAPSVNDVLAFSLPIPNVWIWPVGWVVVLALFVALGRISGFRSVAILSIVLGAISNLIDRTFLGGVTDYLSLTNLFPAFNIADLLILSGIIAWAYRVRSTGETESSEGKKGFARDHSPSASGARAKAERASATEGEVAQGNREVPL